jgi:hypothetical protein
MASIEARKTVRPDSKGRITLGNLASGVSSFKAYKDKKGRIVLEPQVEVPAMEAWLWQNPVAMLAVQKGLQDSAEGKVVDRGSFAQYADEDEG